ncbi:M28 family peptidase [Mangrovimonas xylaniphaga]|uniref:M28 family peptidase n=1 Tax=Mangrovimonas xylaniphaga TaxID=1645915 RepID=UPI0006B4287E|nr:M28 family peptidase [Mangrovimonas xylaniphaga]
MLKKIIALALILLAIYWSFLALKPTSISGLETTDTEFSTDRALGHLKEISKQPHYVGIPEHQRVRDYIVTVLKNLGLETEIQEGYSHNEKWGSITKAKNILARIKGTDSTKALLLLSHYDSNPHSSLGASDAGSGVVTILEGLRAFLHEGKQPKNDIIVMLSDAEELGLNGAELFVNEHPWAKDVGLVLNFESRGSGGPSYMLVETNGGNHKLLKDFVAANPQYPVANSLAYSVYKKLPNDTDLTSFREDGNIDGFNFAFIDDHFDYHTALDTFERLDRSSLEHQGSYLMPLLHYFANADLTDLKSDEDNVYFNIPLFKTVSYPFAWIVPMLVVAIVLFLGLVFYGLKKRMLNSKHMAIGFIPGMAAILLNGLIGVGGWKVLTVIYPQYNEILQGFTYNGHTYILAFSILAMAICMWLYNKVYKPENTASLVVPPLFLWLIICTLIAIYLKGASFFIIPVFFGLISLWILVRQKRPNILLMALLLFPTIWILVPFVKMFPVGLGLKLLVASTVLISLIFSLCISVFGFSRYKNRWAYFLFIVSIGCFIYAHINSDFNEERPKPNSLIYFWDTDSNKALWATYDQQLDAWTKTFLSDNPRANDSLSKFNSRSKYGTPISYVNNADVKPVPKPHIDILQDSLVGEERHIKLFIAPQRRAHKLVLFADSTQHFIDFKMNGYDFKNTKHNGYVLEERLGQQLFAYSVVDDNLMDIELSIPMGTPLILDYLEVSFDLPSNPLFRMPQRPAGMIPKPFVNNDAVMVKETIILN